MNTLHETAFAAASAPLRPTGQESTLSAPLRDRPEELIQQAAQTTRVFKDGRVADAGQDVEPRLGNA
jgi:hypothetical protein